MKMKIRMKTSFKGNKIFQDLVKGLSGTELDKVLYQTGEYTRGKMLDNWNEGKGASGDVLPALSDDYRDRKTGDGIKVNGIMRKGEGKPDMMLTGDMQRATYTQKESNKSVEISVRAGSLGKAMGNANNRPTLFDIDKPFAKKIRSAFLRQIKKYIKD